MLRTSFSRKGREYVFTKVLLFGDIQMLHIQYTRFCIESNVFLNYPSESEIMRLKTLVGCDIIYLLKTAE